MRSCLILAEVPSWLVMGGMAVTLLASLVGVCGALMAQKYIATSNVVREKFKGLREAYSLFVAAEHTFISLHKAHHESTMRMIGNLHDLVDPLQDLKSKMPPDTARLAATQIETAAREDIAHKRAMHLDLNARVGVASTEIHRAYFQLLLLDRCATRRQQLAQWYELGRVVPAQYTAAQRDPQVDVKEIPRRALNGIDQWVADVGEQLFREEQRELESVSWFKS